MCTVSFLPLENDNFILTSNRDETPLRKTISPKIYQENDVELLSPKDAFAGGTWIGASNRKRIVCLLNGAFEKHQRKEFYRKSRGIIVTELLTVEDAVSEIEQTNFIDIEPFTLVLIDFKKELKIFELIWDGEITDAINQLLNPTILICSGTLTPCLLNSVMAPIATKSVLIKMPSTSLWSCNN